MSVRAARTWQRGRLPSEKKGKRKVDRALGLLLEAGTPFDYAAVRELAAPALPQVPELASPRVVDLRVYDRLLAAGVR